MPNKRLVVLSARPFGVPLSDPAEYRKWYVANLVAQIERASEAGQLDRLEHAVATLLAAVRQWRAGAPGE